MRKVQVGIDLGTTNTLACCRVKGKMKLVKFKGGTMLPSAMYVEKQEDGSVKEIVGKAAKIKGLEDPDNYIEIDNELYRIIKIDKDKNIIIIKNDYFEKKNYKHLENILFDVNNDLKYKNYRSNINFEEKQYFSYNFENKNKNFTANIISFINVQDYINVSLDTKCKNNLENIKNCKNRNWLNTSYPYITRDYDGQGVIQISSNGILEKAHLDDNFNIRFVFTINGNIKLNGQGTFEKPYKIVI